MKSIPLVPCGEISYRGGTKTTATTTQKEKTFLLVG